jgi:hypothetical protein
VVVVVVVEEVVVVEVLKSNGDHPQQTASLRKL